MPLPARFRRTRKGLEIIGNAGDGQHPIVVFDKGVCFRMKGCFWRGEWKGRPIICLTVLRMYHRLSADTYKYVELETFIGWCGPARRINGWERVPHEREINWLGL